MFAKGFNQESIDQAKQLIADKASSLQKAAAGAGGAALVSGQGGWDKLQEYIKSIPGAEEARV